MMMKMIVACFCFGFASVCAANELADIGSIQLIENHCLDCHSSDDPSGDVRLDVEKGPRSVFENPALLERVIKEVSHRTMPPPDHEILDQAILNAALIPMRSRLEALVKNAEIEPNPIRRLNRFQYNYTVRDLFQLDRDLFVLAEKLIHREDNYLKVSETAKQSQHLPDRVRVLPASLHQQPVLEGVKPFPKDLRAEHGYDNQANQLTLSPLLLDSFFKLSVSIVESPDFNPETVGIWPQFFSEPQAEENLGVLVRSRLSDFLRLAFRQNVEVATLERYVEYALVQIEAEHSVEKGMKKVAAAVLSSPLFLYRTSSRAEESSCYPLASRLSYFLWSSGPDLPLLDLAESGELRDPDVLDKTVKRMLADAKVQRFLDSFPVQWLQLENVLAATPNPKLNRFYSLNPEAPAGLHMLVEPLLLFDLIYLENRSIIEFLSPEVVYQSKFLTEWYFGNLKPDPVDQDAIQKTNEERAQARAKLRQQIGDHERRIEAIIEPVREGILRKRNGVPNTIDLKPYAVWEFDENLRDSVGELHLTAEGAVTYENGAVVLQKSFLKSSALPIEFAGKSFEVLFALSDLDQRGGGLMTMQGPGGLFDSIVIGERKDRHWISGSNGFARTDDFPDSFAENITDELIHLVMVYHENGTTQLYRNGEPYGGSFTKNRAKFKSGESSVLFGLRHLPAGGNRYLNVRIDRAALYDRPLSETDVLSAFRYGGSYLTDEELRLALTGNQMSVIDQERRELKVARKALTEIPADIDLGEVKRANQRSFDDRLKKLMSDPTFDRAEVQDPRYGGIMTNAAVLTMTSGPNRTHPVARGVWVTEVLFNDPPLPPPNDIPPLDEEAGGTELTIREKFSQHRANPSCSGCHNQLDPLGFALENYDITGRWRTRYKNGRDVDVSGKLFQRDAFSDVTEFKKRLLGESEQFANAFTQHLMRYALARELTPGDRIVTHKIVRELGSEGYPIQKLIRALVQTENFLD